MMANEKRLIDANALMETVRQEDERSGNKWTSYDFDCLISTQPTVDAVEVVRCKDCKYRKEPENRFCNPYCTKHLSMQAKDDDFCSYGERRDNG